MIVILTCPVNLKLVFFGLPEGAYLALLVIVCICFRLSLCQRVSYQLE